MGSSNRKLGVQKKGARTIGAAFRKQKRRKHCSLKQIGTLSIFENLFFHGHDPDILRYESRVLASEKQVESYNVHDLNTTY